MIRSIDIVYWYYINIKFAIKYVIIIIIIIEATNTGIIFSV